MKKSNMIILIIIALFALMSMSFIIVSNNKSKTDIKEALERKKHELFCHYIHDNISQARTLAEEQYLICPPLRPERFRRRVKILWGVDINDYPDNAVIILGGYAPAYYCFSLDKNHQLLRAEIEPDEPSIISPAHSDSIYSVFRKYLFFNDPMAKEDLMKYKSESLSVIRSKYDSSNLDWSLTELCHDFTQLGYLSALFDIRRGLLEQIDNQGELALLNHTSSNLETQIRTADLRFDITSLYWKKELEKGRSFAKGFSPDDDKIWLGFSLEKSELNEGGDTSKNFLASLARLQEFYPWHNYKTEKGISAYLTFLLQLENKEQNKFVIQYMSGQVDANLPTKRNHKTIREDIKSNNYYGYSILREFCENPMREMPTLDKIGTSFTAKVKEQNTLLLLEPFADSYDIDTVQPTETFKAYEMGHDDYYFIEIEKPVESPVADKDGYAMILDRTETVYGYIPKSGVKEYTSQEVLKEEQYTDKIQSKRGVIQDKDGYVNIRKEANAQSDIVGKIIDKEIFHYWQTSDSWYIVETKDGLKGYVYKDRIREKYDTGGWTIDE